MRSLHESDDQLELYALDRLPDEAMERVEAHLIVCDPCRLRMEEVGEFAFTMKAGLRAMPLGHVPGRVGWFEGWNLRFALAGALTVALLLVFFAYRNTSSTKFVPVATLTLTAIRGANVSVSPARELDLTLTDATGQNATVDVVDASGKLMWSGPASVRDAVSHVRVKQALEPGIYFVRLKSATGELLHEYGLDVRP